MASRSPVLMSSQLHNPSRALPQNSSRSREAVGSFGLPPNQSLQSLGLRVLARPELGLSPGGGDRGRWEGGVHPTHMD